MIPSTEVCDVARKALEKIEKKNQGRLQAISAHGQAPRSISIFDRKCHRTTRVGMGQETIRHIQIPNCGICAR